RSNRNVRAEKKIHPRKLISAMISGPKEEIDFIKGHIMASGTVSGLDESQLQYFYGEPPEIPNGTVVLFTGSVGDYLILDDSVDKNKERTRLEKELKEAQSHIDRLEKLLSSDFANKAPANVIAKEREKLDGYKDTAEKLKAQLK
ncbi:MAG: valine--tRNA ligase, partial [Anaerolineales bacterium]|nr:valine--tRNA ligase [Anaerolineales bacterium]